MAIIRTIRTTFIPRSASSPNPPGHAMPGGGGQRYERCRAPEVKIFRNIAPDPAGAHHNHPPSTGVIGGRQQAGEPDPGAPLKATGNAAAASRRQRTAPSPVQPERRARAIDRGRNNNVPLLMGGLSLLCAQTR